MPKIVTYAAESSPSPVKRRLSMESPFQRARSRFVFGSPVMHHGSPSSSPFFVRSTPPKSGIKMKREPGLLDQGGRRSNKTTPVGQWVKTKSETGSDYEERHLDRTSPVVRWVMREKRPWSMANSSSSEDELALAKTLPIGDNCSSNGSEKCYSTTYHEETAVTIVVDDDFTSNGENYHKPPVGPKEETPSADETYNVSQEPAGVPVEILGTFPEEKQLAKIPPKASDCRLMSWCDPSLVPDLKSLAVALAGHMTSRLPPLIVGPQEMIQFKVRAPRYADLTPILASKGSPSSAIAEMVAHITKMPHSHVKLTLPNGEKLQIITQDSWTCGERAEPVHADESAKATTEDKWTDTTDDFEQQMPQQECTPCQALNEELHRMNDDFRCQIREAEIKLDELRQRLDATNAQQAETPTRQTQSERRKRDLKRPPMWASSTPRERKRSGANASPHLFENSKITKKSRQSPAFGANRKLHTGMIRMPQALICGGKTMVRHKPQEETPSGSESNPDQRVQQLYKMLELVEREKVQLQDELKDTKAQLESAQILQQRSLENELIQLREKNQLLTENYQAEKVARKRFFSMLEDAKGKIRVYCRIRPLLPTENSSVLDCMDDFTVALNGIRGRQEFQFDHVFTSKHTQEDVFAITKDMVDLAYEGYNVCIFAYGQTGSGKTYTLLGDPYGKDPGIASRAFLKLFELVDGNDSTQETVVHISAMELYNEKLLDLLHPQGTPEEKLEIRKEPNGMVNVVGCRTKRVDKPSTLLAIFHEACARRHVASTKMNNRSSRSHLIVTLLVESTNKLSGSISRGKFSLVDLAGSERQSKLDTVMAQLREANSINKSLSALGDVIAALASEQPHVPYRNNKLTLLMQDSLGGNAKTLMFVNVSPAQYNLEETTSSLHYAARVKQIKNDPSRITESKEIARLKAIIGRLRKEGGNES